MKRVATYVVLSASMGFVSLMGAACRSRHTPNASSESATASQAKTKDDYIKAFHQKVQALTPAEEQAIMAATVGSVMTDFKKKLDNGEIAALGIPVEKVKEAIKNNPKAFDHLLNSKITLADLAKANKIKSVKEIKILSAAGKSDLDAFPIDDMFPANVTAKPNMAKTGVFDMSSGADQKGLQLVGIGSTFRLLTCGAAIVSGLITTPLFARMTVNMVTEPYSDNRGYIGDLRPLFSIITGALSAQSAIIAKYTCL